MDKEELNDRRLYGWYRALRTTIKPRENKTFFQTFKHSFSGKEVVSVFENTFKMDTKTAIGVGEIIFDKKLIVHVTHKEKFKPKVNSFYRFTNERRSLRHSIKSTQVKEDVLSEITKLLIEYDKNDLGIRSSPLRKRSISSVSPKKPPASMFESTNGNCDVFDTIQRKKSEIGSFIQCNNQSRAASKEQFDHIAKARTRRLSVKMSEMSVTRVVSFEEDPTLTTIPRLQVDCIGSHQSTTPSPSTTSAPSPVESPITSPINTPRELGTSPQNGSLTPRQSALSEAEDAIRACGRSLKNNLKHKKTKSQPNEDSNSDNKKALVSFFKNRKLTKAQEEKMHHVSKIQDRDLSKVKIGRRRSSDLGNMFLTSTPSENSTSQNYDVAWLVDTEKHTHSKKRKSVLQRNVDVFQFENIQQVLHDKDAKDLLTAFAAEEFADENIKFWEDLRKLHKETLLTHRIELAKYLYDTYVDRSAPLALNITNNMVQHCLENHHTGSDDAFYDVEIDVLHSLCDLFERLKFAIIIERNKEGGDIKRVLKPSTV
ncbi:Rgs16 [Acrasis kona]|uniref:Rgs16 n=1 Tax=Acrasis kona TaxID=1008807 RepID=A0AAW2ZF16_9EUKA